MIISEYTTEDDLKKIGREPLLPYVDTFMACKHVCA